MASQLRVSLDPWGGWLENVFDIQVHGATSFEDPRSTSDLLPTAAELGPCKAGLAPLKPANQFKAPSTSLASWTTCKERARLRAALRLPPSPEG